MSCIAVVIGHSIQQGYTNFYSQGENIYSFLFFFATPTFVFLSEFLLAKNYSKDSPRNFFIQRIKFLIIPYICISFIFSLIRSHEKEAFNFTGITIEAIKSILLGNSTTYFVLIIFQFYLIHKFCFRILDKYNPKIVTLLSLVLNAIYLAIFNFGGFPDNYFTYRGYYLLFPAWAYYFTLGYYCGKHYEKLILILKKYLAFIIIAPLITAAIVLINYNFELIDVFSSKRIDILLYTTAVIFFVLLITSETKQIPKFIVTISNYSFSIYLLNKVMLFLFSFTPFENFHISVYIVFAFVFSLLGSILAAKVINKFSIGKYLVGQVRDFKSINLKHT